MISEARRTANRQNALRSTGPTSPEGKAAVARNHLIHGLTSKAMLLPDEDVEEFLAIVDKLREYHKPEGITEDELIERMATATVRRARASRMEVSLLELHRHDGEVDRGLGIALVRDANKGCAFDRVLRYEGMLERSYYRALHELQRLQASRRGEHVPVPVAIDVTVDATSDEPSSSGT